MRKLCVLVALVLATACSAHRSGEPVHGTLREVGGPAPGLNRGVAGTVRASVPGAKRVATARTGSDGRFTLTLEPGTHVLRGSWNSNALCGPTTVHVAHATLDNVLVICSIK
jgi:hypothetical protein